MMDIIKINKCGSYLEVGPDGFVNPIDQSGRIQKKWQPIVDETINFYKTELGDELHSVYIRGSVAKGDAVDFVSDLDSFVVVKSDETDEPESLDLFHEKMNENYPFCNHVEITAITLDEVKSIPPKRSRSIWEELVKTQSRCVFGEDLSENIKPFRVSEMKGHSLYIEKEVFEKLPQYIEEDKNDPDELKSNCMWIMRRLIRSSFDLVMERENKFTRDLYCCYESASKYYPEKESQLREVLNYSLNPTEKYEEWLPLVNEVCKWVVKEGNKYFGSDL